MNGEHAKIWTSQFCLISIYFLRIHLEKLWTSQYFRITIKPDRTQA